MEEVWPCSLYILVIVGCLLAGVLWNMFIACFYACRLEMEDHHSMNIAFSQKEQIGRASCRERV